MAKETKTVLLVDDVQLFLRLEETFFKRAGCRVLTAESGKEAVRLAREKSPDLILLDYYMPDMKGDQVCEELRKDPRTAEIPIIIVSTSSKNEDIQSCFKSGCDDYLTKPIQPDIVLARAASLLQIPHRESRRLPINFRIEGEAPPLTFTGFSRNLSRTGISIEAEQFLQKGVRLKLWLPVAPDNSLLEVSGEVVRSESDQRHGKFVFGIKFLEMTPKTEQILNDYLQKHLPAQEPIY